MWSSKKRKLLSTSLSIPYLSGVRAREKPFCRFVWVGGKGVLITSVVESNFRFFYLGGIQGFDDCLLHKGSFLFIARLRERGQWV